MRVPLAFSFPSKFPSANLQKYKNHIIAIIIKRQPSWPTGQVNCRLIEYGVATVGGRTRIGIIHGFRALNEPELTHTHTGLLDE